MSLILSTSKIPVGSTALFVFSSSVKIVCSISCHLVWLCILRNSSKYFRKASSCAFAQKSGNYNTKASNSGGANEEKDLFSYS